MEPVGAQRSGIDRSRKINYNTQNVMGMVTVKVLILSRIPMQI